MDINPPENDLALPWPASKNGTIVVITGWRGVGKTTYCQQAIDQYRQAGLKVSGLLSASRSEDQQRNGIFAVDLTSQESRLVASRVPGEIDGIRFGTWAFDTKVFDWGNRCLEQARGSDVLVIDELGFLEFDLKTGWMASFELLRSKKYRLALIVIRPECIDAFSKLGFDFQIKELLNPQPPSHLRP